MEELKRCPFCGSIPTLYHDGLHQVDSKRRYHTTWMILCEKCHNVSMSNSAYYSFGEDGVCHRMTKKTDDKKSSDGGTAVTKRIEYGAGTQAENINDSSVGTRSCDGRANRRGIWSIRPKLCTVC